MGVLTGPRAKTTTWVFIDSFLHDVQGRRAAAQADESDAPHEVETQE